MTPDPWCTADRHGNAGAYNRGCRCTPARAAHSRDKEARRRVPVLVDSTGTIRRLRALVSAGWTFESLAARMFCSSSNFDRICTQRRVHIRNAAAIREIYELIGLDEGPSERSRWIGQRNGWPTPIEWGDDIDDPNAKPLNLDKPVPGGGWGGAPLVDIELLARTGETWERTAERLGTSRKSLERRLLRARRTDISARLSRNSETYHAHEPNRNQWSA